MRAWQWIQLVFLIVAIVGIVHTLSIIDSQDLKFTEIDKAVWIISNLLLWISAASWAGPRLKRAKEELANLAKDDHSGSREELQAKIVFLAIVLATVFVVSSVISSNIRFR